MSSLDFGLTPSRRKSAPRQGRRALHGTSDNGDMMTLNELTESPPASIRGSPLKGPASATPHRGRGGWASSAKGGGFGPPAEDRRLQQQQLDDSEDILDIPDLDEVVQDDFTQQVAQAPSVQVNRVATFKELDTDLLRHAAFSTLDDIDLRLLTTALVNETDVREPDIEWRWDPLFAEVSSELLNEWDTPGETSEIEREVTP